VTVLDNDWNIAAITITEPDGTTIEVIADVLTTE